MKTKLLSLIFAMVLGSSITNAQTKVWDFSNATTWPDNGGTGVSQTSNDNLGLYASAPDATSPITNFGAVDGNNYTFPDGFVATKRFKFGGAGYSGSTFMAMPTQRFVYFNVTGACTVKVWFRPSTGNALRTMYVTNGTTTYGSAISGGTGADYGIVTANYTGGAGQLYIYGDAGVNLYKITVTGATVVAPVPVVLSTNDFKINSQVNVFSNGKQVHISNVISNTQVDVYSMTGALVKSFKTDADTSFDSLNSGLYIVNVQSEEGRKAVKVVLN